MDESEGGGEMEVEVKRKRSKRRTEEDALKESARGKKQSEKERRVQLNSIHAESQRLLRETRSAAFKPIAQPVYKPISSVLEKIRLRKLEILKKSNTPFEEDDDDASSEPVSDPAGNSGMSQAKEVDTDDKDLKIDDADNDVGANGSDLNEHDSVSGDEDALTREKDLNNCGSNVPDKIAPKRWRLETNFSQDAVLMLSSMNLPDGIQDQFVKYFCATNILHTQIPVAVDGKSFCRSADVLYRWLHISADAANARVLSA